MAAQTGARREGAADRSRKDGPSRADSPPEENRGWGWGWSTHYLCSSLDTAEQIGVRRKLGWRRGWGLVVGAGGGRSMDHLRAVWTRQYQVGVLCVLFPCLLCSERKIIAFISSVFLKLFDIKIIFFLLGE